MSVKRIFVISALIISSLGLFSYSAFAQRPTPKVAGWSSPLLAQVGPGGQSVLPLREIIRENNKLMHQEIQDARENNEPIGPVVMQAIDRLFDAIRAFLGF